MSCVKVELVSSVWKTVSLDTWIDLLITDDHETLLNTVQLQIQSFYTTSNIQYFTVYISLVKLLLAKLTKLEEVPYSTIITVFYIHKMAACCLGILDEGKAAFEDTQYYGIVRT